MPHSGENFDPAAMFGGRDLTLVQRATYIGAMARNDRADLRMAYYRIICSAADREVLALDPDGTSVQRLLMFGSNNYLGLANHPKVRERVMRAIDQYGTGIGGPPFLNGYLRITQELEERLAAHKQQEDAMIFSSGFSANLALPGGLARRTDCVYYDEYSHASLFDGLRLGGIPAKRFAHN
ncbi:2-amino-3-ketobutyrate CoA ligase [Xanthomonas bromi]|uniref:2-amino-3-ketobutyrate CoA ligase n=2 Tax=Xanthomonas bromi TaxID=56449 RepID=A0A1C3NNN4_9XANT|nr:2-amino-3-ketobutyrate CoA ligase [Xanthomonas bromi]